MKLLVGEARWAPPSCLLLLEGVASPSEPCKVGAEPVEGHTSPVLTPPQDYPTHHHTMCPSPKNTHTTSKCPPQYLQVSHLLSDSIWITGSPTRGKFASLRSGNAYVWIYLSDQHRTKSNKNHSSFFLCSCTTRLVFNST